MPLDTTNFHPQGPVKSVDLMQFYNLFTGVMTDQPVTFSNTLTVGGSQSVSTVPLRVYGATGQNTDLIDLYADKTQAQPGFGLSAVGRFAWGPGGASPQDTFLSRIALQNGHSSDTPGLFLTPALEIAGSILATSYQFSNGAVLTGPTGTPSTLIVSQDLLVDRNLLIGTTNPAPMLSALVGTDQQLKLTNDLQIVRHLALGNAALPTPGSQQQLTLATMQGGQQSSIVWADGGAGPMAISGNTVGGAASSCNLAFNIATGAPGGTVQVLALYGDNRTSVAGQLIVGGTTYHQGNVGINISPDANALHILGTAYLQGSVGINVASSAAPLTLPSGGGGVARSIAWSDSGAGISAIMINAVGGAPPSNEIQFQVSNGSAGGSARALSLRGNGDAIAGGGPLPAAAAGGFLFIPYMGASPTGGPTDYGYAGMVWDSSTTRLWVWRGAWHYVQFT